MNTTNNSSNKENMLYNKTVINIVNSKNRDSSGNRHTDLRAKFAVYYYLTGNIEQAVELSGYSMRQDNISLEDWYKSLDLPSPLSANNGAELVESIVSKLSVDQLADIIVGAAKDGKDNRVANQLIDLYQERERSQRQLKFSQLDVERRVQAILADEDFSRLILTWLGREHIGRRLLTNPAYYLNIDSETLLLIVSLATKALDKRKEPQGV